MDRFDGDGAFNPSEFSAKRRGKIVKAINFAVTINVGLAIHNGLTSAEKRDEAGSVVG